jgi:hypothetical protein
MAMRAKNILALITQSSCLLWAVSVRAETPNAEPPITSELVAKTVTWQLHWDEKSGVIKSASIKKIGFKNNDEIAVRISPLDWIVNFASRSNQVFPNNIEKLEGPSDEVRQRAEKPFERLKETVVSVPNYSSSFVKVSALKKDEQQKIFTAIKSEAFNDESLEFFRKVDDKPTKPLRIWVAPVDLNFPVILCFVEGTAYIGKVYFDTKTLNAVYSDFNYIGDPPAPWRKERLRLMEAIRKEGDVFEFKNGKLIPGKP